MNRACKLAIFLTMLGTSAAFGQQTAMDVGRTYSSHYDLSGGYSLLDANAPPGDCGCFTAHGGFVGGQMNLSPWMGVAGEAALTHASRISALSQNLTLATYLAGPRIYWSHPRWVPFGEFLVGAARGTGSYFPSTSSSSSSATSFAWAVGGGMDWNLNERWAVRLVDARLLHTTFPNGADNSQRQLQLGAGVVIRFGGDGGGPRVEHVSHDAGNASPVVSLSCTTSNTEVETGRLVQVVGISSVSPINAELKYTWSTTGGVVRGEGRMILIDTQGVTPGQYLVTGLASLASNPSVSSQCEAKFNVTEAQASSDSQNGPTRMAPPSEGAYDETPHLDLKDVFFGYDQSELNADARMAVNRAADYLKAHPGVTFTIAGYADERGSNEYNIALGLERAIATRDALTAAGVAGNRLQVLSYGKEKSFCQEDTESCYQLNRRAQFVPDNR